MFALAQQFSAKEIILKKENNKMGLLDGVRKLVGIEEVEDEGKSNCYFSGMYSNRFSDRILPSA